MSTLFNDDNSDSDGELKINTEYASIYDNFRQKEELHKLKARYGENVEHDKSSNSSSSSEDEDNNIQNPQFEKEFLITLACLKNEDPRIYDKEVKFFSETVKPGTSEDTEGKEKGKKKKDKTLSVRDYERKIIMERDGRYSISEDEDYVEKKAKSRMLTYVEEQKQLKDSFKNALKDEDEDENNLLKIKQKAEDEKYKEEKSYKEWLKGQEVEIDLQDQEMLKPLRDFWMDPDLDVNEKFLRDYILNNKHGDNETYDMDLEYNQIAHDSDENLSEDEKTIQKQEEFEHKYNFRFEEPDQEFIKRYPRTMENSMRKKDTRRAQKRIETKQRKEEEKQQKREELKQLKALKRKEIEEKIEKLKEITGNDNMCFDNVDFDADFDPNEHDRKMRELFNDEYYADGEDEDQKPEFLEIDEESDIESSWDKYDPTAGGIGKKATSYEEPHCEDPDFNMDADYDESQVLQSELIENTKRRKRRRRSKFAELIAKEKPKFDPKQFPSYKKYFDEYYSLDYEDMIDDIPCRFKYRKVVPNDYGLNVEEILMADERELNKWCSLKQVLKHKPEHVEKNEVRIYKQKAMNEALKQRILKSLYIEPKEEEKDKSVIEQIDTSSKKRRKKKKSKVNNLNMVSSNTDTVSKNKILDAKNSVHNNSHNSKKHDEKQDNEVQDKNIVNNSKKQKRKNKLNVDGDVPIPKKMKIDNEDKKDSIKEININNKKERDNEKNKARKKNSQIKAGNMNIEVENNIKAVNNNEKIASVCKHAIAEKKNKNFQLNEIKSKKSKSGNAEPIMSLNAERLKTYGINAKKFKNKLKYGNKQF